MNFGTNILIFYSVLFSESQSILCHFHMKQDWQRYLAKGEHKLTKEHQKEVMMLWSTIADSLTPAEFQSSVGVLQSSKKWTDVSEVVKTYFRNQWLNDATVKVCTLRVRLSLCLFENSSCKDHL